MKAFRFILSVFISLALVFASCSKDDSPDDDPQPQTLTVDLGEDRNLLEGATIILDAGNPGSTYVWSTGETTQTITVDTTGEYSVIVTKGDANGSDAVVITLEYKTIKVETDFGDFRIWLYPETPLHKQNFIDLSEQDFYNGLIYHRVVYDFVVQGGDPEGTGYGGPGYNIPAEIIPGLNHVYGAVGMARWPDNVNPDKESNGSQYYIVCDPDGESFLDGNYTVFGFVFSGIEAVFDISQVAVDSVSKPLEDVVMNQLTIQNYSAQDLKDLFSFDISEKR
ncbi:MAG: peptidylprolyl isomerase [Bacteroidales bacterium]